MKTNKLILCSVLAGLITATASTGYASPQPSARLFPVLKALQTAQCSMPRHRWTFSPPWGMEDLN